jgi:acetolactate synthase-1/2/3 large subunit
MTSGAEAVVEALRAHGVDTVFGIPGVHSLPIYDALDRDGFIRHVLARHEQGAGFMAEGYARTTGRVGVALVTSGPAVTNIATPAASAYTDSVPLLVIATDLATKDREQRAGVLHELKDQQGLAGSLVGWQRTVTHADQIYGAVRDAMHHLEHERPRGAILCIPHDLLQHEAATEWAAREAASAPDAHELVERAADLLARARRPLIVAGAGLRRGGKVAALTTLAQVLSAPILLGPKSRDLIDEDHPYALWGRLFTVPDEVRQLIDSCDATVVLGSKLAAERTQDGRLQLPHPVVQVDIDGD